MNVCNTNGKLDVAVELMLSQERLAAIEKEMLKLSEVVARFALLEIERNEIMSKLTWMKHHASTHAN